MNKCILKILNCPNYGGKLRPTYKKKKLINLISQKGHQYNSVNQIVRFVEKNNYTNNFGHQWNIFAKTQLDSFGRHNISEERFFKATGWTKKELFGKLVLDIGCGSGRFSEIALKYGAIVVAIDYSIAIDAAYDNLKKHKNFFCFQADIYSLPFKKNSFDFIFCLGVLQHTPDVKKAFDQLPKFLKINGKFCADFYWKRLRTLLNSKYLVRPFTKRIPNEKLFNIIKYLFPIFYKLSNLISKIPILGIYIRRILPVANYNGIYNLSKQMHYEWALLDTYDMLAPKYDNPQTSKVVTEWMSMNNFKNIECVHAGHLVVRGTKN